MTSSPHSAITSLLSFAPAAATGRTKYNEIYQGNCHRVYSLAFWMTDNELTAEQLSSNVFLRAFAAAGEPTAEHVDRALISELRELMNIGALTLETTHCSPIPSILGNIKRIHLERAIVQLPATEKLVFLLHDVEGYTHERIGQLLGLTAEESKVGLHQARLKIRELVGSMM